MSRHNLAIKQGKIEAFKKLSELSEEGLIVDIKTVKKTRSNTQNRALHLYYKFIVNTFLEHGISFKYIDEMTGEIIEIPYTVELVKERIWRPVQIAMFNIKSTTKIDTFKINQILEVLAVHFAEKGFEVKFPNKYDQLIKQLQYETII